MEESWGVISLLFKSPWIDQVNFWLAQTQDMGPNICINTLSNHFPFNVYRLCKSSFGKALKPIP
jgi:hypothetical protein